MKKNVIILAIILAISAFFFRSYIFSGKVLFPSNMMVAFYPPWNVQKFPGWINIPFKGLGQDNALTFYPVRYLLRQSIAEHSIPLWNPYNFAGGPLMGDGQSAVMYPLTQLYLWLPLPDAFSIMVILVPTLTMLFMYGMLRHFNLSRFGSLFGAVTFAFCGFMSVWMEENPAVSQSALWLPLLVWILDLFITKPKRRWFAVFAVGIAVMMSAGHLQICIYELVFLAAFGLFRIFSLEKGLKRAWQRLYPVLLSGATGLLLVAPYLATTWESYKLSPRDFVNFPELRSMFLVQWSHLLSLFNPDWLGNPGTYNYLSTGSYYDKALFIGVVPLVFALFGLWMKKSKLETFLWWVAGITLFLGISSPFTQWIFGLPIPILSTMLPSRIFYLSSFALTAIAAFTFERICVKHEYEPVTEKVRNLLGVYAAIFIVLEVFLIAALTEIGLPTFPAGTIAKSIQMAINPSAHVIPALQNILLRNVTISVLLTGLTLVILWIASRTQKLRLTVPYFIIVVTVISAWYFTSKSLYAGEREFVYPQNDLISALQARAGLFRIGAAHDLSKIKAEANAVYGLYSPDGLNPVYPFRYGQLIESSVNGGKLTNDVSRLLVDLNIEEANTGATTAARLTKLMALLGVKFITEKKESGWYRGVFPTHKQVWEDTYFRIWENPDALPRTFVVTNVLKMKDSQKILDALYDPMTDLRTTAMVEDSIPFDMKTPSTNTKNAVTITSYHMNNLTISAHLSHSGLLVLTDTYAPGWHAVIDGKETPVYRTDFTLRGIPVTAGDHTIYMYYWPESLTVGIWAMGCGILLLLGGLLKFFRKPDTRQR